MKEYKIRNLTIYKSNHIDEDSYRKELSGFLIKEYGRGSYSDYNTVRKAITFAYNYYCDKFVELCKKESSVRFYQLILSQHEQATEVALFANKTDYPEGISADYIAIYRRILKWILEQASENKLHNQEKADNSFVERAKSVLNRLCFLGDMIFFCANIYAEQDMIEDVAEIVFDHEEKYIIKHKHHYDLIIQNINETLSYQAYKHVVDDKAVEDLQKAIKECFGIEYGMLTTVIQEIHKANESKGGQYCGFGWESLPLSVQSMFGADPEIARVIFKGLTLDRMNKLKLHDLACKPQTLFRYLYRPILIWNIEGEDFAVIGMNGFKEAIIQLTTNCIPWGKAPQEWLNNRCFKDYMHSKEDEHDKWLDDKVEDRVKSVNLPYFRNITHLQTENGSISLNSEGVGEIDFIIIIHELKKIFVADCKHLQGKYDMMTQKNDFSNFTKAGGYNQQIENKINFLSANLNALDYSNKETFGHDQPDITTYQIEGIFIINTPTFYMFNSDYRIYSIDEVIERIFDRKKDTEMLVVIVDDEEMRTIKVDYPYFKKPDYELLDLLNTEE